MYFNMLAKVIIIGHYLILNHAALEMEACRAPSQ